MLLTVLFPFRRTYRDLDLRRFWWHRLAIALFGLALLVLTLPLMSSRISYIVHQRDAAIDRAAGEFMDQTLYLDDTSSSHAKTYEWSQRYSQICDAIREQYDIQLSQAYGASVGFCLSLSYILQLLYRLAIYVVFGSRIHA
jgi:hypothetical protein